MRESAIRWALYFVLGGINVLNKDKRNTLKKQRIDHYDMRIFEFEMDLTAAEAAGEEPNVTDEIKSNIEKLQKARAAVEQL